MPDSFLFSVLDGDGDGAPPGFWQDILVRDVLWPPNSQNMTETGVDEDLQFVVQVLSATPGLCPYRRAGLTLLLNNLNFEPQLRSLLLHTALRVAKACRTLLILALTTSSAPLSCLQYCPGR